MNLQIVFLGMLDHWIHTNKVKADGGPEWPTLKETRANISLSNPRQLKTLSSTPIATAACRVATQNTSNQQ